MFRVHVQECGEIAGLHVHSSLWGWLRHGTSGRWSFSALDGAVLSAHHGHLFIAAAAAAAPSQARWGDEGGRSWLGGVWIKQSEWKLPCRQKREWGDVSCKVLRISYKDRVANEEVCAKIPQACGPHEDLLTIVKRQELKWYGHVSRSPGRAKTILQGTVKRERREGRQRKKWEDNIREWTSLEFAKPQRAVENRKKKLRKLVVKSSVVHQRPPRLRERWKWTQNSELYEILGNRLFVQSVLATLHANT